MALPYSSLRSWWRRHPVVGDGLLAGGLAAVHVLFLLHVQQGDFGAQFQPWRDTDALGVVLAVASCIVLVARRRWPLLVLVAAGATSLALAELGYGRAASGVPVLVALYTVATCRSRRTSAAALGASALTSAYIAARLDAELQALDVLANLALFFGAWAFGRSVRLRRAYVAELELRASRLERAREADLRAGVAEERGRIARELHDVVAHSLSVMIVQASAAQRTLDRSPERSREAMTAVETTGRTALQEMRRVVGVLRTPVEDAAGGELAPQPGVPDLPALLAQFHEAGLAVDLQVRGTARALPAGVDLTAYRLVQEALTNTLKHAGPTAAVVELDYGAAELGLRVTDRGRGASAALSGDGAGEGHRAGHGLRGMRERVGLYGGQVSAGPRSGGGFAVAARLPLEPAAPAAVLVAPAPAATSAPPVLAATSADRPTAAPPVAPPRVTESA